MTKLDRLSGTACYWQISTASKRALNRVRLSGIVKHLDRATLKNNGVGEKKFDDNVQTDPEELPSDPSVVNFPKWVSSDGLVNAVADVFATLGTAVRAGLRLLCPKRVSAISVSFRPAQAENVFQMAQSS